MLGAVDVAEAAVVATGGVGSSDGWSGWWDRGDRYLRDIDDGMRRMRDGRDGYEWAGRVRDHMRGFRDHLRGWDRGWEGWDNRYQPVFDDWTRRWDGIYGRYGGRDWGGDWRAHAGPFRSMYGEFDGFRNHFYRVRGDWGRGYQTGPYRDGYVSPGTAMGGWR